MEFHYVVDHEHRQILVRRSGNWDAGKFIESFDTLHKAIGVYTDYIMVSDMRHVHAQLSSNDISSIADILKQHPLISGETLIIVDRPLETALAMLYKNAVSTALQIKIFSTREGVSEHLGVEIEPLFEQLLPTK